MQLLIQFCSGRDKKAIESCVLLHTVQGYMKARRILSERFGDHYQISRTWLAKVRDGAPIKSGNGDALQDLADDLENCQITLEATGRLSQLNHEDSLVRIIERCPMYERSRWQSRVQDLRAYGRDPTVEDIRRLIRVAAKEKCDPVFGAIMDGSNKAKQRPIN